MGGIIWLASYPKSGNTWLRAFLNNLLRNPDTPADINRLDQFCFGDSAAHWYAKAAGRDVSGLSRAEVARLRPQVHRHFTESFPDSVFVKTHNYLREAEGVPLISLDCTAAAIYLMRNPLDVAISLGHHFGLSQDRAIRMLNSAKAGSQLDARNVYEYYGTWSDHVASWTGGPAQGLLWLRYEDLIADPHAAFARIAGFLGLEPPPERLDKAIRFSSFETLRGQERRGGFNERPAGADAFFRIGQAEQWRGRLSPAQIEAVVAAHGEQMARFGYLP